MIPCNCHFFSEIHDKEPSKQQRDITPTFKEYNNKQVMVIYDIEGLFPYRHQKQ